MQRVASTMHSSSLVYIFPKNIERKKRRQNSYGGTAYGHGFVKRHKTGTRQNYRRFEAHAFFVSIRMAAILRTPDVLPITGWFIHFLSAFCFLFKPQFDEDATVPSVWKTVALHPGINVVPFVSRDYMPVPFIFCTRITVQTKILWRTTGFPVSFFASLLFFLLFFPFGLSAYYFAIFFISVCRCFVILLRFGIETIYLITFYYCILYYVWSINDWC